MRNCLVVVVLAAYLAACGHRGALYLPPAKAEAKKPAAAPGVETTPQERPTPPQSVAPPQ